VTATHTDVQGSTQARNGSAHSPLEGNRSFVWFTPAKRKATEYESYTVGQQSGPDQWLQVDWPLRFDDGRAPWEESSSAVRTSQWRAYRDPAQLWQRPYVSTRNQDQQAMARLLPELTRGAGSAMAPEWSKEIVGRYYAAWPFVEYGLFLSLAYAVRQAMSDTVQFTVVFQAADRMRLLQDIVYHLDHLSTEISDFTDGGAREAWMNDPALVPIRHLVESIVACEDWVEALVAATLAFEPILGDLAKSQLFTRYAADFGDRATPVVLAGACADTRRHIESMQALVRLVCADPEHGEANRTLIGDWVADWQARCVVAAHQFLPVFKRCGVDADGQTYALTRAVANAEDVADGAGVAAS